MDDKDNDKAKHFITLVDTFYDRSVKLIVSADATPVSLYRGAKAREQLLDWNAQTGAWFEKYVGETQKLAAAKTA